MRPIRLRPSWPCFVVFWLVVQGILGTGSRESKAAAQDFPDFPASIRQDDLSLPQPEVRQATTNEYGLRDSSETRPAPTSSHFDQHPAVVSSSYHRAVVHSRNNPSTGEHEPQHGGRASSPSGLAPTEEKNPKRWELDSQSLTPLTPPGSSTSPSNARSRSSLQMMLSIGSSLMVVLGLFFGLTWLYRKSTGGLKKGGGIPQNVVQVLGRTLIGPRQHLLLLRFGSKLVLVNMVQGESRTISEITDPLEVDRLAGLFESGQPGSVSNSFREMLSQGVRS